MEEIKKINELENTIHIPLEEIKNQIYELNKKIILLKKIPKLPT